MSSVIITGCEFVVVEGHHDYDYPSHEHEPGYEYCFVEPLPYAPEQCWDIFDYAGYFEGECCEWDVGSGHFEDWCLWHGECDWEWEYSGHYVYY